MVTRYDIISSRWSSHFWVKMQVFQLLSTIKVKLLDEMMQSAYLCVILHVAVLTWFLILGKIQDGDHFWWRHRPSAAPPIKFTSSFWKDQRLSTEGKIVSKCCNISKTWGRGSNTLPPCITVGVWICGYVRGLRSLDIGQVRFFRSYQPRRRKG